MDFTERVFRCSGVERVCSFTQSDPCYAALGDKLNLLMMVNDSIYDLTIKKRMNNHTEDPVCRLKYGNLRKFGLYNNRSEVTAENGTLIINPVEREDSGNYRLYLEHSDGTDTSRDLKLNVEGTVNLSSDALLQSHVLQRSHYCTDKSVYFILYESSCSKQ